MRLGIVPSALGTTAECVRDYCRMCQGLLPNVSGSTGNLLPPTGEFPYSRPRIDPLTNRRRLAENNSSKSGGKLRVLRYFSRNTRISHDFDAVLAPSLGTDPFVVGDRPFELGMSGLSQIPITANSFYAIFAVITNPRRACPHRIQGFEPVDGWSCRRKGCRSGGKLGG